LVREVTIPGDFHLTEEIGGNLAILHRGGRNLVFDFGLGKVIDEVAGELKTVRLVDPDKGLVYVTDGDTTTVRNTRTQSPVWTKPGFPHQWAFVTPEFLVLAIQNHGPQSKLPQVRLVDTQTGEHVTRFDHVGQMLAVRLIGRQKYVLVRMAEGEVHPVCDFQTGRKLWDFRWRGGEDTADGDEWQLPWSDSSGNVRLERYRMSDGAQRSPGPPRDTSAAVYRVERASARYALDMIERDAPWKPLAVWAGYGAQFLNGPAVSQPQRERYIQITDRKTCRRIGVLETRIPWSTPDPIWLPQDGGVLVAEGRALRYFSIPPRRNWWSWGTLALVSILGAGLAVVAVRG